MWLVLLALSAHAGVCRWEADRCTPVADARFSAEVETITPGGERLKAADLRRPDGTRYTVDGADAARFTDVLVAAAWVDGSVDVVVRAGHAVSIVRSP